ncbi:TraR/DksA family transcriptional regulator [Kineococcus aurantiacus]|uniref:DnaK suppressor protein n=1 Tax=Kineococcus aurantiacus TaxID=37633 RepID=A0A7Y9DPI0_9ACTN|nr:dksa/trar family transcriptional regulator [Kineococcus aurantiacus]NYD24400.1 DnaK suppressor protein [Kineococcus aurantiacus]
MDDSSLDLDAARERLLTMQRDLRASIDDLTARLESGSTPDAAEGGQDAGDMGSHEQQAAENEGLLEGARRRLDSVEDALKRLDEGTYGLSVVSGRPIPPERLEALPDAATLVDEQV